MHFHPIQHSPRFTLEKSVLLLTLGFMLRLLIQPASAQLTIQIVNDSGLSDSNVFVMVPGASGAQLNPSSLFVDKNTGTNTAVALSTLGTDGSAPPFQIVSPISGNTDTVYSFQTTLIKSGDIYFIYNNPFAFVNGVTPSPSPDGGNGGSGYRYDYAELSFLGGDVNNDVDLTYVDKFGIPLQLEWFHGTNTVPANLVAGSYVYASIKTLAGLFTSSGFGNAVYGLTNAGAANGNITPDWQYSAGTNAYANFARILAPQKLITNSPYPSVTNILNYLTTHPFDLNGYSVQGSNYYIGYGVTVTKTNDPSTGIDEWLFTLAYNSSLLPPEYSLAAIGTTNTQLQYTNTITFLVPNVDVFTNFVTNTNSGNGEITTNTFVLTNNVDPNIYIYGAPSGTNYYLVNGAAPVNTNTQPVELWMIGDVLSAINFGFVGGIYGNNSDRWFSPGVTWPAPYGWAQPVPQNDVTAGYYNAYAALAYYNADAYTFAYSERITPDVGMAVENGDVIRITILPDDRLDSPVVSAPTNLITDNAITLTWNPIPGATSYQVNMLRPSGFAPVNVSSNSYRWSGLNSGTPYVMSVQALGTANGHSIITPARPISATTTGTYTTINNGTFPILVTFNAADPFYQLGAVFINGIQLFRTNNINPSPWEKANGQDAQWNAITNGLNQVVVTVLDNNTNVIFNDWLQFDLHAPFQFLNQGTNSDGAPFSFTTTNAAISDVVLYGQNQTEPAPTLGGLFPIANTPYPGTTNLFVTNYVGSATNFLLNPTVVIGLSYVPAEIRKSAPGQATTIAPVIVNVASVLGGKIRFDYNVPVNAPYVIESSGDLITWQTNFTGISQTGTERWDPLESTCRHASLSIL